MGEKKSHVLKRNSCKDHQDLIVRITLTFFSPLELEFHAFNYLLFSGGDFFLCQGNDRNKKVTNIFIW